MLGKPMRTTKREITDMEELAKVLAANQICRIAFKDEEDGYPYIVPINYGYEFHTETGELKLYFHCALEGRKLDLLRKDNRVGFEIDQHWGLRQTPTACRWAMNYDSIIGVGKIHELEGDEKKYGMDAILRCHGRFDNLNYDEAAYRHVTVLCLTAERFTGKSYRDKTNLRDDNPQIHN